MLDHFKRKKFLKNELKSYILKSFIKNLQLPYIYRYNVYFNKIKLLRVANHSQITNRCVITGRPWYVINKLNYSRFVFRTQTYNGNIPGFKRASW